MVQFSIERNWFSSNQIRYYYENILRSDLLLKLSYKNSLQIPQARSIIILAQKVPANEIKNLTLALEIISGQKIYSIQQEFTPGRANVKRSQNKRRFSSGHLNQTNFSQISCSLRSQKMYNFLEKLNTILTTSFDYKVKIQKEEIQIILRPFELRLFPEIQNHYEFFENFQNIQIKIVTTAKNEKETELFWKGLHQKEI